MALNVEQYKNTILHLLAPLLLRIQTFWPNVVKTSMVVSPNLIVSFSKVLVDYNQPYFDYNILALGEKIS